MIFLIGYMGVGKTTVGRGLAKALDRRFVDLDDEIERGSAMAIPSVFAEFGECEFRVRERIVLSSVAHDAGDAVIAAGGGTPCFYDNMRLMMKSGVVVYLRMDAGDIAERFIGGAERRPLLGGFDGDAMRIEIARTLAIREPVYLKAHAVVDVGLSDDVECVAGKIVAAIRKVRPAEITKIE